MSHQNLRLATRSADMIREHRRDTMIRKMYWGVLASIVLSLAFATGCNSTTATPPVAQVTTVTAMAPFRQTQVENTTYVSPFTATVTTNGTPVGGASVVFAVTPSVGGAGGTFAGGSSSATVTSDATMGGQAVSPAFTSNGTPGAFIVTASIPGNPTSTAIFTVVNTVTPLSFTSTTGDGQSATVSTDFGTTLTATVLGPIVPPATTPSPVVGILVTFTAPSTGASGTFADSLSNVTTAITDANGVATAVTFTANATAGGPYTVAATVPVIQDGTTPSNDTWLTTNFSLTNTPAP